MPISLEIFLAQSLLVFGFATPEIAPYTGVYFVLATMLYGFRYVFAGTECFWDVGFWRMLLASVVLLLVPMPFHWLGIEDLYPLLVILPILLAPGVAALVRRHPDTLSLETMCWALLGGIVAAVGLAWYEAMVLGVVRLGGENNPIHFGCIVAILGFGAMTGVFIVSSRWRFVLLLAPVLAAVAIIPYLTPEHAGVASYNHLRSDLADFGVSGGMFELAALAALLLSTLVAVQAFRNNSSFLGLHFRSSALGLGFLPLGLTNAAIGRLPQTEPCGLSLACIVGTSEQDH